MSPFCRHPTMMLLRARFSLPLCFYVTGAVMIMREWLVSAICFGYALLLRNAAADAGLCLRVEASATKDFWGDAVTAEAFAECV